MGAKALNPESRLLGDLERQRQRMGLESSAVHKVLPEAPVLMVGAQLSSAFRPFARDLASKLGPPNATDEALERIAETMLLAQPELMTERIEVESKVGVQASPEGYLLLEGPLLPKEGLATLLRKRWLRQRAPRIIALPAPLETEILNMKGLQLALILHPNASPIPARGLQCQGTERTLSLHGDGDVIVIDRDQENMMRLWQLVEDIIHNDAPKVLLANRRDSLLKGLLDWMNNAG